MPNSFRPVGFRLPLSDVAAVAAATARAITLRWRRNRTPVFGFRLRLKPAAATVGAGWTDAAAVPETTRICASIEVFKPLSQIEIT